MVNIGVMWERWSGGLYPATLHRVVHRNPVYRVSVPFFFEPNFDARVRLLDAAKRKAKEEGRGLLDDQGVTIYGEYLLEKVGGNFQAIDERCPALDRKQESGRLMSSL